MSSDWLTIQLRRGLSLHRGNRAVRSLDSTTMQEGDRASTSGTRTGSTHSAREFKFYTFHGERPPAILWDFIALFVYFLRQSGGRGDRRWLLLGGSFVECSFFTPCLRVITLTILQTAGVFLSCVHDYRAVCTVQAVRQTAAIIAAVLVVSSQ